MNPTLNELSNHLNKTKGALEYHVRRFTEEERKKYLYVDKDGVRRFTDEGTKYIKSLYERPAQSETKEDEEIPTDKEERPKEEPQTFSLAQVQTILATVSVLNSQLESKDKQLEEKDWQIREKDRQIESLLRMVEDNGKKRKTFWQWLTGK